MKAELKGHEFDLDALMHLFPSGPIRVVRENGIHYLLANGIDNRPQGVQYYEVAPNILKTVNGLARVIDSAYQPVELSGYYFQSEQRHVVVSAENASASAHRESSCQTAMASYRRLHPRPVLNAQRRRPHTPT